ncbi:LysM peptidoglycan-binding domain-containing protein [Arthrobacter sp. TMN-37]
MTAIPGPLSAPAGSAAAGGLRSLGATGGGRLPSQRDTDLPRLRLTRRGRVLLVGVPLVLLAASLVLLAASMTAPAKAGSDTAQPADTVSVNVAPGETLWSLAGEFAPDRDPRDVVSEIVELNGLGSSTVQAGQIVALPVSR